MIPPNPAELYFKKSIERDRIYYTGTAMIEYDDGPASMKFIHS